MPEPGQGSFSFDQILTAMRRRAVLVVCVAAALALAAHAVLRHLPEAYTASSIVWLNERQAAILSSGTSWEEAYVPTDGRNRERVVSSVLTSVPVLRRVVVSLELYKYPEVLDSRLDIFRERLMESVGIAAYGEAGAAEAGEAQLVAAVRPLAGGEDPVSLDTAGTAGDWASDALMGSDAGEAFSREDEAMLRWAVAGIADGIEVQVDGNSEIAVISFTGADPEVATAIVNALPEAYAAERRARLQSGADGAVAWLAERVEALREELQGAEREFERFVAEHGLDEASRLEAGTDREQQAEEANAARAALVAARARLAQARTMVEGPYTDPEIFKSMAMDQLLAMRASSLARRLELLTQVGPTHGAVRTVDSKLAGIDRDIAAEKVRIVSELEAAVGRGERTLEATAAELDRARPSLLAGADMDAELVTEMRELQRRVEASRTLYNDFLKRLTDARQLAKLDANGLSLVQPALTPGSPSSLSPNLLTAAVGFGALVLGFGMTAGFAMIDGRVSSIGQLTGLGLRTVIAAPHVRQAPASGRSRGKRRGRPRRLTTRRDQEELLFDEAIRRILSATFYSRNPADSLRGTVLMVTSGARLEGKSTIALAVARMAARTGTATVLVEADLRRTSRFLDELDGKDQCLAQHLADDGPTAVVILRHHEDRLDIVPTATAVQHSTELLASPRMKALMERLKDTYELIVVDTSPICMTPDPVVLAGYADHVALVVQHRSSTMARTRRAIDELWDEDRHIIGVLNKSDMAPFNEYYGPGEHCYRAATQRETRGRNLVRRLKKSIAPFGRSHAGISKSEFKPEAATGRRPVRRLPPASNAMDI